MRTSVTRALPSLRSVAGRSSNKKISVSSQESVITQVVMQGSTFGCVREDCNELRLRPPFTTPSRKRSLITPLFASILHDSPSTQLPLRALHSSSSLRYDLAGASLCAQSFCLLRYEGETPFQKHQTRRRRHDNGETHKTISRHSQVVSTAR